MGVPVFWGRAVQIFPALTAQRLGRAQPEHPTAPRWSPPFVRILCFGGRELGPRSNRRRCGPHGRALVWHPVAGSVRRPSAFAVLLRHSEVRADVRYCIGQCGARNHDRFIILASVGQRDEARSIGP